MDDRGVAGRAANRARWDEAAPLHAASALYDVDGFRTSNRDDIRPFEFEELGSVRGLDLIHLQCHLGTDTLSWARHGARVVGLDFSPNAIGIATKLAADCALEASSCAPTVLDAGLVLELLHEQGYTNAPWPWMIQGSDGYYRLRPGWPRYPLTYSLRARKPPATGPRSAGRAARRRPGPPLDGRA